jgi:hypothetical protein
LLYRSFAAVVGLGCLLASCADEPVSGDGLSLSAGAIADLPPPAAARYEFQLTSFGADDRHELSVPVPVGRSAAISVSLSSQGEAIVVGLEAKLTDAPADGSSQIIDLVVVSVDADDDETIEGLAPMLSASSTLLRDERLAVVEQVLDVPPGLSFRAEAVARQALRAPFALIGPLALQAVGSGAEWTVETMEGGAVTDTRNVVVVSSSADGYVIRFDVPEGAVELSGRPGALLPGEQVVTLDDAVLTVTAERIG